MIIATSGSTGEPKGVELSAAALLHSARASLARLRARPGERWLCCLPVTHVAGLQVLVRSLVSGTDPVVADAASAAAVADAVAAGCAHVSVVPTQLVRLLADDGGAAALAALRSLLVGGAAADQGLLDRARAAGVPAVTTYGMSETCGGCVYDGLPLDAVSVRAGDDGLLRISGPVLMNGYRGQARPNGRRAGRRGIRDLRPRLGRRRAGRGPRPGRRRDQHRRAQGCPRRGRRRPGRLPRRSRGRRDRPSRPRMGRAGHRCGGPREPRAAA